MTLYERLGGKTGIQRFIDSLATNELMDPEIASYFYYVGMPGHPTATQVKECLVLQLGQATGGAEEMYPGTVSGGFKCRSMKEAHAHLHIPQGVFEKFLMICATTAKSVGISDPDILAVGGVLVGTETDIVDPAAGNNGFFDAGPRTDATAVGRTDASVSDGATSGTGAFDAGPRTGATLYARLGRNAGIQAFVDTLAANELMDPEIASYFYYVGMPGHPTAAQIKECLVLQLGQATGGPERYPGNVSGNYRCRAMGPAHAQLRIPRGVFDKFVSIAAMTAKAAGVANNDVTTLGNFLNGTRAQIVNPNAGQSGFFDAGVRDR